MLRDERLERAKGKGKREDRPKTTGLGKQGKQPQISRTANTNTNNRVTFFINRTQINLHSSATIKPSCRQAATYSKFATIHPRSRIGSFVQQNSPRNPTKRIAPQERKWVLRSLGISITSAATRHYPSAIYFLDSVMITLPNLDHVISQEYR